MIWLLFIVLIGAIIAAPFIAEYRRLPMDGAARNAAPGKIVELTDGATHIRLRGPTRGPIAVCVHGLTTPEFVWDDIVGGLNNLGYRVLSYDLYGRGFSDRPDTPQTEELFVRQLSEVIETAKIPESFMLVGYSMGASISVAYAAQNPDRVERLVLLAPAGMSDSSSGYPRFLRDTPIIGDWLTRVLGARIARSTYLGKEIRDLRLRNIAERQAAEVDYRGYLPAVLSSQRNMLKTNQAAYHNVLEKERVRTLAIWAEQDSIIPLSALGNMAQANRSVIHETVRGAGHGLPFTHPGEVMAAIRKFIVEN